MNQSIKELNQSIRQIEASLQFLSEMFGGDKPYLLVGQSKKMNFQYFRIPVFPYCISNPIRIVNSNANFAKQSTLSAINCVGVPLDQQSKIELSTQILAINNPLCLLVSPKESTENLSTLYTCGLVSSLVKFSLQTQSLSYFSSLNCLSDNSRSCTLWYALVDFRLLGKQSTWSSSCSTTKLLNQGETIGLLDNNKTLIYTRPSV
jgi:hypothetical protein